MAFSNLLELSSDKPIPFPERTQKRICFVLQYDGFSRNSFFCVALRISNFAVAAVFPFADGTSETCPLGLEAVTTATGVARDFL